MRYSINKTNHRDFKTISENRLPHRSHFIPFRSEEAMNRTDYLTERFESDAVILLSGKWDFAYFKSSSRLPNELDTDKIRFDTVPVPSTWQKTGYDQINYLNSMYPFRCNPPKTPKNCAAGVYRKKFNIRKNAENTCILTFLGVAASLDVYLNGRFTGYGEGSHNSCEFDITPFLKDGENELVAVVYKWSTGTYLECQDMFRENGIFRDVYLTELPKSYLYDFSFITKKEASGYTARVITEVRGKKEVKIQAQLLLDGVCVAEAAADAGEEIVWEHFNAKEWNAEIPICYDLVLTLSNKDGILHCLRHKVGFRTITLDGCRYLLNGKAIKLKGVNHHDSHPVRGYAMTVEDLKKDIELMKEYNVNCMRTSHYPPDPILLTLCDVYGIYVVDEADLETHGCFVKNMDLISDDPKWEMHYLDRIEALFERDKNHTGIVMWSMGNEAGGIKNFDACYEYLKTKTEIPVHYEPACRSSRIRYDILSYFYTPPGEMRALARKEWKDDRYYDAPFFLCEYAHSMGVGPGGLDEYQDVIYSDSRFLGGCIWEWADHAHYDAAAKYKYTYGGDHGDRLHNGNFCCDGLFYPDRTPSSAALCMKNVYSPLRAQLKNGKLFVYNTNRFADSTGILISYYLLVNGEKRNFRLSKTLIPPEGHVQLDFDLGDACDCDTFLILEYLNCENGTVVASEQIVCNEAFPNAQVQIQPLKWTTADKQFALANAAWDREGRLVSLKDKSEKNLLAQNGCGFMPMLYQAVIDNHIYMVKTWKKAGLHKLKAAQYKGGYDAYLNTVTSIFYLTAGGKKRFRVKLLQKAASETTFLITCELTGLYKKPLDLLQIGLNLELDGRYQHVTYYGMGEAESYSDFSKQSLMGVYETSVGDMYVPNIKPQESGNHCNVRWAEITDGSGHGLRITALDQALNFKAVDIDNENLRKAKHMEDVIRQDKTVLHINSFMRGIGSQSCGPDTAEHFKRYLHFGETCSYSFQIEIL